MKRMKLLLSMLLFFLLPALPVSASARADLSSDIQLQANMFDKEDILSTSIDANEVYKLDEEINRMVQELCDGENLQEYPKNIDYENAVRVYVGADLMQMNSNRREDLLAALEESESVWVIPAQISDNYFQITVSKGLPLSEDAKLYLSEEEQQQIIDNEGKWCVTSVSYTAIEPYRKQVIEKLTKMSGSTRVVLVGAQSGFQMPVAVGFDKSEAKYLMGLGFQYPVSAARADVAGIYEYSSIHQYVMEECVVSDADENQWGGIAVDNGKTLPTVTNMQERVQTQQKGSLWFIGITVAVIMIGVVAVYFWENGKEKRKQS